MGTNITKQQPAVVRASHILARYYFPLNVVLSIQNLIQPV